MSLRGEGAMEHDSVMDSSNDDDLLRSESSFLPVYSPLKKSADFSERNFHAVFNDSQRDSWEITTVNKIDSPKTNEEFPIMTEEEANKLIHLAATILQARIRGYLVRRVFNYKTYKRKHDAACKIQALWRGYYFRHLSERGRIITNERRMARLQKYIAALCIDMTKRQRRHEVEKQQLVEAITVLYEKMTQLYDVVDAQNFEKRMEREKRERNAAVILQKRWRGYLVRKKYPSAKPITTMETLYTTQNILLNKVRYLEAMLQLNAEKRYAEEDGVHIDPVFLPHPRYKSKENHITQNVQQQLSAGKDRFGNATGGTSHSVKVLGKTLESRDVKSQETNIELPAVPSSESMHSECNSEYWSVPESFTGEQYTTQADSQNEIEDRMNLTHVDQTETTHHVGQTETTHHVDQTEATHHVDLTENTHLSDQTGATHHVDQIGTTHPSDQTETTQHVDQTETTQHVDQTETTRDVDQTGTTHDVDKTGTTHDVDKTGTTHPSDQTETTHPLDQTETTHPLDQIGTTRDVDQTETTRDVDQTETTRHVDQNVDTYATDGHVSISTEVVNSEDSPGTRDDNNDTSVRTSVRGNTSEDSIQMMAGEHVENRLTLANHTTLVNDSPELGTNETQVSSTCNDNNNIDEKEQVSVNDKSFPQGEYDKTSSASMATNHTRYERRSLESMGLDAHYVTTEELASDSGQITPDAGLIREVQLTNAINVSPRLGQRATSLLSALKTELTTVDTASPQAHSE